MPKKLPRIPIEGAENLAKQYGCDQVIILGWWAKTGSTCVATYGKSLADCDQAAQGGNWLKTHLLKWPECEALAEPNRVKTLKKRIKELEAYVESIQDAIQPAIENRKRPGEELVKEFDALLDGHPDAKPSPDVCHSSNPTSVGTPIDSPYPEVLTYSMMECLAYDRHQYKWIPVCKALPALETLVSVIRSECLYPMDAFLKVDETKTPFFVVPSEPDDKRTLAQRRIGEVTHWIWPPILTPQYLPEDPEWNLGPDGWIRKGK